MSVVIKVENLTKTYQLGVIGQTTLQEALSRQWSKFIRRAKPITDPLSSKDNDWRQGDTIYALQNLNFEVKKGEVLGIIGKNGAGKSTLLKILSKITAPTSGNVKIKGRIASLLEVGTGMHPELTGRENIFLNGAILGMQRAEIRSKLDAIIDFAGIDDYIDTPIKRYSSGMRVRLGFAVAAFLEPEILIVDEVLAVGDAEFQKKAIGKMQDVAQGEGRTVLFVSHNMQAVSTLTSKAILMDKGNLILMGDTNRVIKKYLHQSSADKKRYTAAIRTTQRPQITGVDINTSLPGYVHEWGKPIEVNIDIYIPHEINHLGLSFQIIREDLVNVAHLWIFDAQRTHLKIKGVYNFNCQIKHPKLYMGSYTLTIHLSNVMNKKKIETLEHVCSFEVQMYGMQREYKWVEKTCTYLEEFQWNIKQIQ